MEPNEIIGNADTIAAISTPQGSGGIAVIRISGPKSLEITNKAWKGTNLLKAKGHTTHFGVYVSTSGDELDEALATVFRAPASFTGEDTVELSIHGSKWIQREVLNDLISRGARMANPGEFTQRAFLNGKIDLTQAEGVADLISSSSKAAHDLALRQTRGSFSKEFENLRGKLIEIASLLELELDFSEEDVEFADRSVLKSLCDEILQKVENLANSYSRGAVLKEGVPVVIAGIPNAGKSSLLNLLLNDEKAIVTDIPGTTRDIIEDTLELDGILFRFIDTAGIRETSDTVEEIGVERARKALEKAFIVIWVIDSTASIEPQLEELKKFHKNNPDIKIITLLNKSDIGEKTYLDITSRQDTNSDEESRFNINSKEVSKLPSDSDKTLSLDINSMGASLNRLNPIPFSSKTSQGLPQLISELKKHAYGDNNPQTDLIVTNARHYESLTHAAESLRRVRKGLIEMIPSDFVAIDLREALHHLGTITGAITTDTLLTSIFSSFCIGK